MSAITPQTEIRILKCNLSMDELNQLTFSNATTQANYFKSLSHDTVQDNCTYLRKEGIIRYPKNIDSIIQYNYVMYKNENFSDKWFYAFIENMEFANPNMTNIKIKTDVFQTWQFDITYKASFVEREHVNSDNYAEHTIPEGLETGEYITAISSKSSAIGESHIVMGTTVNPTDGTTAVTGGIYGGIYSGVKYYIFQTVGDLNNALVRIAGGGNSDSIVSLFYCPDWITGYDNATFVSGVAEVPNSSTVNTSVGIGIPLHPTEIDGYTPKNKKLFTYPYVAYLVSNNSGDNITYRLEDFLQKEDEDHNYIGNLEIWGTCTPGGSIRLIPQYYKVKNELIAPEYNNEYGLTAGKYPIASWGNDAYTNWLTQNGVNIAGVKFNATEWGIMGGGLKTISGLALSQAGEPGGLNMAVGGITDIFNTLQEDYRHSFNSMQASGNTNSGDVTYSSGNLTFTGYFMTIKSEYARIIDKYFSMYGYKVNSVKVPNITGRTNWNYVKTIDCNLEGNIPQDDLIELKSMFNRGITLWHNPSTFLDYSRTNNIT